MRKSMILGACTLYAYCMVFVTKVFNMKHFQLYENILYVNEMLDIFIPPSFDEYQRALGKQAVSDLRNQDWMKVGIMISLRCWCMHDGPI